MYDCNAMRVVFKRCKMMLYFFKKNTMPCQAWSAYAHHIYIQVCATTPELYVKLQRYYRRNMLLVPRHGPFIATKKRA